MNLGDIWAKLANQARLTPEELDFLRRSGNETQQRNQFVGGNTTPAGNLDIAFPFFPIYSQTVPVNTASVSIPIPSNARHLMIMGAGRTTGNAATDSVIAMQFNGDTGANYSWHYEGARGTTAMAAQGLTAAGLTIGDFSKSGAAAGEAGSFFGFVPHCQSAYNKNYMSLEGYQNWIGTDVMNLVNVSFWNSTSKVQSIRIYSPTVSIAAGSSISVYGLS